MMIVFDNAKIYAAYAHYNVSKKDIIVFILEKQLIQLYNTILNWIL